MRDRGFAVTGGCVTGARQVDNSRHEANGMEPNREWRITVKPDDGVGQVTVVLLATADCESANAICTSDSSPLSAGSRPRCGARSANGLPPPCVNGLASRPDRPWDRANRAPYRSPHERAFRRTNLYRQFAICRLRGAVLLHVHIGSPRTGFHPFPCIPSAFRHRFQSFRPLRIHRRERRDALAGLGMENFARQRHGSLASHRSGSRRRKR